MLNISKLLWRLTRSDTQGREHRIKGDTSVDLVQHYLLCNVFVFLIEDHEECTLAQKKWNTLGS